MKYTVTVKRRGDFVREENGEVVVGIRSAPEKGKANQEIIQKLAKYFNVPQTSVFIVSGATSRKKIVLIEA